MELGNSGVWDFGSLGMFRVLEMWNLGILEFGNSEVWDFWNVGRVGL